MQRLHVFLLIILLVHTDSDRVLSLDKCSDGYIHRQIWKNRYRNKNICCKKVTENCKRGYYLKECKSNLSRDVCTRCPETTWLADETNSSNVHECVDYSCLIGAKRVDYLPKSGCHMPCVCDTERNFYGFDSCNCKLRVFEGTCPANTKLALNGSCLSYRDAEKINDLRPKDGLVAIPVKVIKKINGTKDDSSRSPDNSWLADKDAEINDLKPKDGSVDIPIKIIKKINGTKDDSSRNPNNSWLADKWVITSLVSAVIVFVLFGIFLVFCIHRRRRRKDTHNKENPAKPTSDVSDSGVSVTSSSAYELDEINHEQQKLVNKIDVKHTSDQTENKIDIKCVSDQRDDKTSEPCQQMTLVEINKQDQIVKQCIKGEVKVLCHSIVNENISKYSSQKETEKQVAKIAPFRSEDDMMAKVTDPLLGLSDGGGGYPENEIDFQRPLDISDPHHDPMEDNTLTGFTPMHHDFGSSLRMTNSLIDVSDT